MAKNDYKSGITGMAYVRFGGKILIKAGNIKDMPGSFVLALCELKGKNVGTGNIIPEGTEVYDPQVILYFPDLNAINNFRDQLNTLEDLIKEQDDKKLSEK